MYFFYNNFVIKDKDYYARYMWIATMANTIDMIHIN